MMKEKPINYWKTALIILAVIACGLLVINQTVKFMGYNRAINDPCGTCVSIPENEHLVPCFDEHSHVIIDQETGEVVNNKNKYNVSLEVSG